MMQRWIYGGAGIALLLAGSALAAATRYGAYPSPITPDAIERAIHDGFYNNDHVLIDPMPAEMRPLEISRESGWPAALTAETRARQKDRGRPWSSKDFGGTLKLGTPPEIAHVRWLYSYPGPQKIVIDGITVDSGPTNTTTEWHGADSISRAIVSRDGRDAIIYINHAGAGSWYWLQRRAFGTTWRLVGEIPDWIA